MALFLITVIEGTHTVQVSENVIVGTGVDGETVFGRVETVNGRKSILKLLKGHGFNRSAS